MKCDFCSSKDVRWSYPARDFSIEDLAAGSLGAWAACDTCHELIEADARSALLTRSIETAPDFAVLGSDPVISAAALVAVKEAMRDVHTMFFKCRTGPAQRLP